MLKLVFSNVPHVTIGISTFSPAILMSGLRLQRCKLNPALEGDDSSSSLPPFYGRFYISDPRSAMTSLLSLMLLPLRSVCHTSGAPPPGNEPTSAYGGYLESLGVRMVVDWGV